MPEALPLLFIFILGLCVGSFVNVQVFRFGFAEKPRARSACMACDKGILWYDLIPVFSYLALRGRCRACGSALSLQYPLVEIAVGCLFLLSFWLLPPVLSFWPLVAFVMLLTFLAALTALVAYDMRHTLIPLPFVLVLAAAALAASAAQSLFMGSFISLIDALAGGAFLFASFFALVFATRGRGMGMGDAYVVGAAGLLLGLWRGLEAVMLGVWSATLVYLIVFFLSSVRRKKRLLPHLGRVTLKSELPFVPFLALGIALALFTPLSPLALGAWLTNTLWLGH